MHPAKVSGFLCCHWGLSWGFSVPALTPPRLKAEKNQEAVRERVHDEVEIAVKTESALNYCNFYIAISGETLGSRDRKEKCGKLVNVARSCLLWQLSTSPMSSSTLIVSFCLHVWPLFCFVHLVSHQSVCKRCRCYQLFGPGQTAHMK